jgi:Zn-dependent M28 family amino/carboxypeptidase
MPKYTQPTINTHSIQFQQISMTDSAHQPWALAVSYSALQELKKQLAAGTTRLHVVVETRIYPSEEYTVVANIRGEKEPDQRFVYSAHIQEPGANDNASGVGTLAEMARVAAVMVRERRYHPQRTLTFLWGDEIRSTHRYITDDTTRAKGIHWGLSLDMVGEDASKTGGSFLIEKMPDPSAIWTRGNDHHTEWGGSVLKESDMFPHYFNDFVLARCRQQGQHDNWIVNSNPFEGGSDHTPFLQAHIPGLLMWHFTDQFYHTDGDRLDKVSPEEMQNVGVSALAVGLTLCNPPDKLFPALVEELKQQAETRLETEYQLSKTSVIQGSDRKQQAHILEVWGKWYEDAIATMQDIPLGPLTDEQKMLLQKAAESVKEKLQSETGQL